MGKRGPNPAGKLRVLDRKPPELFKPPRGLAKRERDLFTRIVEDHDPGHFNAGSVPLLVAYVQAAALAADAQELLARDGIMVPCAKDPTSLKAHPAVQVAAQASGVLASLYTKLRLREGRKMTSRPRDPERDALRYGRSGLMFGGRDSGSEP